MNKIIDSQKALYDHIDYLREQFDEHKYLRTDTKTGKQRTSTQNASLHLYCQMIADELTERGINFEKFFKQGFEVPWTMEIVKDNIWRPVQIAICGEESTTKVLTSDYQKIYDPLNVKLIEMGMGIPWPSKHTRGNR